ncbi:hypothetical protein B566_EDAN010553 [Ephemera danica]|nr:hypothetical protein B566_EDAN010553 [Ephemera danica]
MSFGSYVTMKSLLICFNIVFCVLAVILIAIGGLVQHGMRTNTEPTPAPASSLWFNDTNVDMSSDKKSAVAAVSIVLIVIGCSAFFLAFLGCFDSSDLRFCS